MDNDSLKKKEKETSCGSLWTEGWVNYLEVEGSIKTCV